MNSILSKFFYAFYDNFYFKKILFIKNSKTLLFSLNSNLLNYLFLNSYLLWKNIFKKNFWNNNNKNKSYWKKNSYKFNFSIGKNSIRFTNSTNLFKNNFLIFYYYNNLNNFLNFLFLNYIKTNFNFKQVSIYFLNIYKKTFGEGFCYIRGLFIIFFIDACITDDEPLWEPIEWSLVQTWLLFIFIFAWIAENLITSRYGNYTGRDKRVWFAWYKTFWLIELCYALSYGLAALFVIVPFYFELTYSVSFIFSWWNWYTRIFFLNLLVFLQLLF